MGYERYVALLRGINISGKNKISMVELKNGFEGLSFENVKTYLNSGNVVFSSSENDTEWWGGENKEIYHKLIFIIPPKNFSDVYDELGEPKKDLEKIQSYKQVIFWSFNRKEYQKTNWWSKTATAAGFISHLFVCPAHLLK